METPQSQIMRTPEAPPPMAREQEHYGNVSQGTVREFANEVPGFREEQINVLSIVNDETGEEVSSSFDELKHNIYQTLDEAVRNFPPGDPRREFEIVMADVRRQIDEYENPRPVHTRRHDVNMLPPTGYRPSIFTAPATTATSTLPNSRPIPSIFTSPAETSTNR